MLNQNKIKATALGNIGVPLIAAIENQKNGEIFVVELSSWQLETLRTPIFDAGAILNITPNHLDRHASLETYAKAKFRLAKCLKPAAPLFLG